MIKAITVWVTDYEFNSRLAFYTYWVPMMICLLVYLWRSVLAYQHDVSHCRDQYYNPKLTLGVILLKLFLAVTPVINLFALVFDCFASLGALLEIPLVSHRPHEGKDK